MKLMDVLGILVACVLLVGTAASQAPQTYSYRYRLTVSIAIDGQLHTGSSVIEVNWRPRPDFGNGPGYLPSIRGQAVFVDLGARGAIVAALQVAAARPDLTNGPWNAEWIAPRAFHMSVTPELPDLRMEGRRQLARDNMPQLIWFSDPNDPTTARKVLPDDVRTLIDPNGGFEADIEITGDPIMIDIDKKLPWFNTLSGGPPNFGVIYLPSGLALGREMFIGAAS
jgi:hypothetical protein